MTPHLRHVVYAMAFTLLVVAAPTSHAQIRYAIGQNVQPIFEGWLKNPDGTHSLVFGYLNRNWEEVLDIPVGPNNRCEPAPIDCGQPTRFFTRRQRFVFKVAVPKDWDPSRDLQWIVTAHGRTDTAKAWLQREYEINYGTLSENGGGGVLEAGNQPPSFTQGSPAQRIALDDTVALTVHVTDDGLPKPRPQPRGTATSATGASPSSAATNPDAAATPTAATNPNPAANPNTPNPEAGRGARGVRIRWVVHRGTGKVTFEPENVPAVHGKPVEMTTKVSFSEPGTYVLRAIANDGQLETTYDVTVTVNSSGSAQNR